MVRNLIVDRRRLYWTLNIAGWGGYVLAAYLGALAHEKPDSYLAVIGTTAIIGFLLTFPMRAAFHRLWNLSPLQIMIGALLICYVLALGWACVENLMYWDWVKRGWRPSHWHTYFAGVMGSFYILMCWSGLYFGIKYYQQLQQQTEQTLKATAAAHQAQLKMLRYQLNPHFLFNTLNAISTLILDRQNETANLAVTRLSDFLRYSLDNDPMKRVTLRSELEALDLYLEIEKVRFGDRLLLKREVEAAALDALVPSLILQPLIENAIKYAVSPREEGGSIRISAKVHRDSLLLTIADDGPGLKNGGAPSGKSSGVGLANTRERLKQLYGDNQAFTLAPNDPSGLVITINIPLEKAGSLHG
ncbi:MAG: histidine kinase [Gammaproteobacteria bacterium]|nr:histidine kinase [Gammaproteobacteria bacterium]